MRKLIALVGALAAVLALAACGKTETKTVTQAAPPASTSTTPSSTSPSSNESMGSVPDSMASNGRFDATNDAVLRQIESKVVSAASANGLRHVVAHCNADSSSQVTCTVRGTNSSGQQGDETDVIQIDQQTGELTLVSQS